jgi:hypothetical protein
MIHILYCIHAQNNYKEWCVIHNIFISLVISVVET